MEVWSVKGRRTIETIELKEKREFFQAHLENKMTFEIRRDRNFEEGQLLILKEFDDETNKYTGRKLHFLITYVSDFKQKDGYVVLATKKL